MLSFYPEMHEVVEGEVVEVTDFGAFVRIGPEDALLHVSQIMDDYISFDEKHGVLVGKESQRKLGKGDMVRGRIIAVSFPTVELEARSVSRCASPSSASSIGLKETSSERRSFMRRKPLDR